MAGRKLIKITRTIVVNKNAATVFNFFANPSNDSLWRTEINQSLLNGPLAVGARVAEYSFLSKKAPNNLVELACIEYAKDSLAVFETPENAPFYLRSRRQVTAVADEATALHYSIEFDAALVTFAVGFPLPRFIISFKANSDMKKYLKQLKVQLEKG